MTERSQEETNNWWKHFHQDKKPTSDEKQLIEEFTGRLPYLLNSLVSDYDNLNFNNLQRNYMVAGIIHEVWCFYQNEVGRTRMNSHINKLR